jgi:alpha,alpha-trehalase
MNHHRLKLLRRFVFSRIRSVTVITICLCAVDQAHAAGSAKSPQDAGLKPILQYISSAWDTLTRSMTDCQSIVDPKIKASPVLYLPANFEAPAAVQKLSTECKVRIEHLPMEIHHLGDIDSSKIQPLQ